MASSDDGGLYQMVGDLRPTVGMTTSAFAKIGKQDPFEAPGNALEGNRIHQRTPSRASDVHPDSARRDTFPRRPRSIHGLPRWDRAMAA